MWVLSGCERNPRRNADRRICHAIGKPNPLARDPIDIRSFDPVSGAAKRVGAKLVAHDEQDIGLHEQSALEQRLETVAAIASSANSVRHIAITCVRLRSVKFL